MLAVLAVCDDCVVVSRKPYWCCLRSPSGTVCLCVDCWWWPQVAARERLWSSLATPLLPTVQHDHPPATGRHRHTDIQTYNTTTSTVTNQGRKTQRGCNQGLSPLGQHGNRQTVRLVCETRRGKQMSRQQSVHSSQFSSFEQFDM